MTASRYNLFAYLDFARCVHPSGLGVHRTELSEVFCASGGHEAPSSLLNCLLWPIERGIRTAKPREGNPPLAYIFLICEQSKTFTLL